MQGSPQADPAFWVVALAASAGGLAALSHVLSGLPAEFPCPVLVVQHLDPHHRSWMAEILARRVRLEVRQAQGGEIIRPSIIYIAPPDHHLLVTRQGVLSLSDAALVRYVRPSADLLFSSLAASFGAQVIAVVLSGTGRDGADGVRDVKHEGGTVIAQDEATSDFFGMPGEAIKTGAVDRVLPLAEIAAALVALTLPVPTQPAGEPS
ncbi:MAG TPA: chemotaxis protein CheB [Thermoanaerobaculia bacterium]|nr:chemotaxis protein CheB [Thermoanaerobaculia bacterium]